jgi:hypothetical protein
MVSERHTLVFSECSVTVLVYTTGEVDVEVHSVGPASFNHASWLEVVAFVEHATTAPGESPNV